MSSWQTKPGNSAKGWNDPPMFIYGSGPSTNLQSTRRNVLSKRVGFPVNENPGHSAQHASHQNYYQSYNGPYSNPSVPYPDYAGYNYHNEPTTLLETTAPPPPHNFHLLPPSNYNEAPAYHGPVVVPTMPMMPHINHAYMDAQYHVTGAALPTTPYQSGVAKDPMSELPVAAIMDDSDLQVPNFADDEQMYHYCVTRLQRALNECRTTTVERLINDMQKKLDVFSEMWKSGKISYVVKSTMSRLATAIHRRKYSVANELHLVLMMDHISEVSRWLVGIKKLVQEVEKAPQQPTSPSVSCSYDDSSEISQDSKLRPLNKLESLLSPVISTSSLHPPCRDVMTVSSNYHQQPNADLIITSDHNYNHHFYNELATTNTPHVYDHFRINDTTNVIQQMTDNVMGLHITQAVSRGKESCDPSIDQHGPRLSCSPPTFDPLKIDQCFNDHGELLLKFVGNDDDDDDDRNNNETKNGKLPLEQLCECGHDDSKPVHNLDLTEPHECNEDGFPCQPIKGGPNLAALPDNVAHVFEEIDLLSGWAAESSTCKDVNGY